MPEVGPDDVLVRVGACGVSYRDVVERNGTYRRDVAYPSILGLEIAGSVVGMGSLVADLAIGDHVCTKAFSSCGRCRLCRNGRETTCFERRPVRGGYAEYAALPQDAVVRAPESLPFEIACGLGPGAGVALNACARPSRPCASARPCWSPVPAAGVGVPAVQIARGCGARVLAVTRSEDKRAFLERIGVDEVLVAASGENYGKQVKAITGGGVDVVIDTVGSRAFDAAFDSLAVHGRYAMVGQLFGEDISINPARIFFKRAQILGVGSVSRSQLEDAIALAVAGVVRPQIARVLPLEDVAEAHRLVEGGAVAGRVILKP
ncbi:MAG: zinc-binding dehydrogenase [Sphingomonas sp.]